MRKKLILAFVFFAISIVSFASVYFFQKLKAPSALQVTAAPKSQVYLDGEFLGSTPLFSDKVKQGLHAVKIIPEGQSLSFEQKIKFSPLFLTAIDRIFRETEEQSEGHILMLEQIPNKQGAELFVSSLPLEAQVFLDGEAKGVTPLSIKDVSISDHELELKINGFTDKKIRVKTSPGFRLLASVKLAIAPPVATPSPTLAPSSSPTPSVKTVKIKQTPTGFLRVRFEPSLSATEVAQVKPGETFPVLEENSSWTKISLPSGKTGWISNQYISTP